MFLTFRQASAKMAQITHSERAKLPKKHLIRIITCVALVAQLVERGTSKRYRALQSCYAEVYGSNPYGSIISKHRPGYKHFRNFVADARDFWAATRGDGGGCGRCAVAVSTLTPTANTTKSRTLPLPSLRRFNTYFTSSPRYLLLF